MDVLLDDALVAIGEGDVGLEHPVGVEKVDVAALVTVAVEAVFHVHAVEIVVIFRPVKFCDTGDPVVV